jgi:hypothetical protein
MMMMIMINEKVIFLGVWTMTLDVFDKELIWDDHKMSGQGMKNEWPRWSGMKIGWTSFKIGWTSLNLDGLALILMNQPRPC